MKNVRAILSDGKEEGGDIKARSIVRLARIKEKFGISLDTIADCPWAPPHVAHFTTETTLIRTTRAKVRTAAYGIAVQTCKYFVANHRHVTLRELQIFCIVTARRFYANLPIFVHCSCINIRKRIYSARGRHSSSDDVRFQYFRNVNA